MSEIASHYAGKAERYARFRWDYAPAAIAQIVALAGLRPGDAVADIGAGPGTLSRWLLTHKLHVWAVEPEAEMRSAAEALLGGHAHFYSRAVEAEATWLPAASLRLITVGRALHWFAPAPARREFSRILQPDGWLAVLAVRCSDPAVEAAVKGLATECNGFDLSRHKKSRPAVDLDFYLRPEGRVVLRVPAVQRERWPQFIGRLSTLSGAPGPGTLGFALLEQAARSVFERFAVDDILTIPVETQVRMGHMKPSDSTCQGESDQ
jgi:SAM-dependent methyltransferase